MIVGTVAREAKDPKISKQSVFKLLTLTKFIVYVPLLTDMLGSSEILTLTP